MQETKLLETLKATYENRKDILDWNIAGNYAKGVAAAVAVLILLNIEHAINLFPMARPIFTLIGLGVVINWCSTKQGRATTKEWVKTQVDRFF